jgi:alpha-L-glutamate ligase-like protein
MRGLFTSWMERYEDLGILGMNSRNSDFILKYNPRKFYPLVDDKIQTKDLAEEANIPTPPVYDVIEFPSQTIDFAERMRSYDEFVVKPAKGSGGGGIIVINGRTEEGFKRPSGAIMPFNDMRYHLTNILSGLYSLGGQTDKAIVQYRVHPDSFFAQMTTGGVPDIRVIVFQGVPVMGMLRLPTRESDGKANLHAGGIGVGVSIKTGETTHGVYRGAPIAVHPDTSAPIMGRTIPAWDAILDMSSRFYGITGLGYLGVDIVIDRDKGPMMLEVNARPGIAIQVANQKGLKQRLLLVEQYIDQLKTTEDKIIFAKEHF